LSLLETLWDPWTIRNFGKLRVEEGWHCLELAGGGGSIAEWLCRQVGSSGHVVATDLETRFLEAVDEPNLEVWCHDILRQPLPERKFDLVHPRAVLAFLPQPAETITKMVAALKPGGCLLVESADFVSAIPDPSMSPAAVALSKKGWDAVLWHLQTQGYDTAFGRHLYHDVAMNGLGDLQAEGFVAMQIGGALFARFWEITLEQVRDHLLEAGRLTPAELEDYRFLLGRPEYRWLTPTMMSVWGRRTAQ
jgi:ubiquinone/menaquinone biosynthesis C-methylase UbiE